jgi:pantothenate kinase
MSLILDSLLERILQEASHSKRLIVAIAGPPGSGKSTLAEAAFDALKERGEAVQILPMDGFHLDNGLLSERGLLPRKGAPETFDVRGFADILRAIRSGDEEVLVPIFDREREITIGSARAIAVSTQVVLVEGNYLLLSEEPWSRLLPMFDLTVFINPGEAELEKRLLTRWQDLGMEEATVRAKVEANDLPNGRRVIAKSIPANVQLYGW